MPNKLPRIGSLIICLACKGKWARVNITTMGTGPGGTAKIRIRGQSSFSGQNNPLIIVNGVPIDNSNYSLGGNFDSQTFDPAKGYEQINTQYWVATFLDGNESVANFKRSGFPTLKSNPYPGSELKSEDFIRRLPYPDGEIVVNSANMNEAIARQGPNNMETRIWWDKK